MKRFLVATVTNVEMGILKTFMENSLKCLQSLSYSLKNTKILKITKIPYQKETIIYGST